MLLEAADPSPEASHQNSFGFLSLTSPKPQHMSDKYLGDRGSSRGDLPSSNLQSCLRTPCTEGHPTVPCSWCMTGCPRRTSFPSTHGAAGFPADENWTLKKILLIIQEVPKLGNAGEGKIVLKDLGRIIPLGKALIFFFFFLVLSLVSNISETHWKI